MTPPFEVCHTVRRTSGVCPEESVSLRIVIVLGGWSSDNAIELYRAAPTEHNIITSMSRVDL